MRKQKPTFPNESETGAASTTNMKEFVKTLRSQAIEIARAGHNGWGNTMTQAADLLTRYLSPRVKKTSGRSRKKKGKN